MVCSRFASFGAGHPAAAYGIQLNAAAAVDQLYDTLYGLLRNHLDGFVDIPEKVGRVRFSRRFLRLKQIHAQRCLKIGITTETELLAKADDRSR